MNTIIDSGAITARPPLPKAQETVEQPHQDLTKYPKWEYPQRKDPKWGEVTKQGLIVGREKRVVPPDEVYKLAELGCTNKEIAEWFMIKEDTLNYNFCDYLTKARAGMKRRLRSVQLATALAGNATLLIWLGKQYLGQSDTPANSQDQEALPWNDE
jgi:hypothetical protein